MTNKNVTLIIALILIVGLIIYLEKTSKNIPAPQTNGDIMSDQAPELSGIAGYINTPENEPITIKDLIGKKVILIDFWTFSCINCKRTQPYLNDWYEKYQDDGLEIIGVHTPEFKFEEDYENVTEEVIKAGIKYPVVLDNDYATWQAYKNKYWPRKYLIDINGKIVYDHIGEGAYAETEKKIQELLMERAEKLGEEGLMGTHEVTTIETKSPTRPKSPEIYFGSHRFDPSWGIKLSGEWETTPEFIKSKEIDAEINYTYNAKDVYMVAAANNPTEVDVYVDEVKTQTITIQAETLYTLVEGAEHGNHDLRLEVKGSGIQVYTFTFG